MDRWIRSDVMLYVSSDSVQLISLLELIYLCDSNFYFKKTYWLQQ